jgi:hypothetical protein
LFLPLIWHNNLPVGRGKDNDIEDMKARILRKIMDMPFNFRCFADVAHGAVDIEVSSKKGLAAFPMILC